jgi:hypothetical protein
MKEFDHIGIVTTEPREGESWVPYSKVWVTNPRLHPQRIEYIRPAEMPEAIHPMRACGSFGACLTWPTASMI